MSNSNLLLVTAIAPASSQITCANEARKTRFLSTVQFEKTFAQLSCKFAEKNANKVEEELTQGSVTAWTWRQLVLLRAAASSFIEAVAFTPTRPETSQLLFACRNPEKNAALFVSPFERPPAPRSCRVLKDEACIELQTEDLDASYVLAVRKVLQAFLNDAQTSAIALTLPSLGNGLGGRVTTIWSKP